MRRALGRLLRGTALEGPARYLNARLIRLIRPARSQSNEAQILTDLSNRIAMPRTFVEFGFHWHEFNCISLTDRFEGLLIDGDARNVALARKLLPARIDIQSVYLTLDNLDFVAQRLGGRDLGILSIDVDGNDYWFLQRLIELRPTVIAIEYNASFLSRRVSVPYKPDFDRHREHPSGLYCGASLSAFAHLCDQHDYSLVAISDSGVNAFFVRNDARPPDLPALQADSAYRESTLTNQWSGMNAQQQWRVIEHLAYVEV